MRTSDSRRASIVLERGVTTTAERGDARRRTRAFSCAMTIVAAALGVMFVGATIADCADNRSWQPNMRG